MKRRNTRATAEEQDLLIKSAEIVVLEEISIGNTKMRLCSSLSGKTRTIQLWSDLSSAWVVTYRYKVEENWQWWSNYAHIHNAKQRNEGGKGNDPKPLRKRRVSRAKP